MNEFGGSMEEEKNRAVAEEIESYIAGYRMDQFLNLPILERLRLFHFPAYTNIYLEQTEARFFYFLVKGQLQCVHYHMNGKLAVIALTNPLAAIGDLELFSGMPIHSNVISTRQVSMLGLPMRTVEAYGSQDPRFLRFIIDELKKKLYSNSSLLSGHVLSASGRLALFLLSEASTRRQETIELPEKESLASLLGTTLRHLNRIMHELQASGAVDGKYPSLRLLDRTILEDIIER